MTRIVDIVVPAEQEGTKAVVRNWLKKSGDRVSENDPVVELETDKVAVEIAAPVSGILTEVLLHTDVEVSPGAVLGRIAVGDAPTTETRASPVSQTTKTAQSVHEQQLAPGIKRLLAEFRLDASEVPVSGSKLSREDILAEAERRKGGPSRAGVRRVPHASMRKRIAEHLSHSVRIAPHVTAVFEADFTRISEHRRLNKSDFERAGANLTFTSYFVSASAHAMAAAPAVNGRWFDDCLEIYDDVNVGVGTALGEKGLVVPVIPRAQALSLLEIAQRLTLVTQKARDGQLAPADVQGGTFSISNHGVSGSLVASPIIINQPQSAILGIGKLQKRAIVREVEGIDVIEVRPMAYVTLTIDHRVIDAFQTNAWLSRFVEILENWPD